MAIAQFSLYSSASMTLLITLVTVAISCTSAEKVTPVEKVVELLTTLEQQLIEDGNEDAATYNEYAKWALNETATAKRIAGETKEKIDSTQSQLEEQAAFREDRQQKLEKAANELAKAEAELQAAKEERASERANFEKEESELVEGIDQLERSLIVMAKTMPTSLSQQRWTAPGATLVAVAKKLKKTLEHNSDFALTSSQRATLDHFLATAVRHMASAEKKSQQDMSPDSYGSDSNEAPDFLQTRLRAFGPYGEYESKSGGITDTLNAVLTKTREQLEKVRSEEQKAVTNFKSVEADFKREIANKEKTKSEMKSQINKSEEQSGQMKAQLLAAQELLKVTTTQLQEVETAFAQKKANYKERVSKRSDEAMAVQEAKQILTSKAAQQLFSKEAPNTTISFLQTTQVSHKNVMHLIRDAPTAGVVLLALKMHTHSRMRTKTSADPFGKVRGMVRQMLEKLQQEAQQEAQHNAYCESEMAKSKKSLSQKEVDVQKLADQISAMEAEISQLGNDIKTVTQDLNDMTDQQAEAVKVRDREHADAVAAIAKYKDAKTLLKTAITALKNFYGDFEKGEDGYDASGMSSGVIALLEVALEDYADLLRETELTESTSARAFKEMMDESDVRRAVFTKELEYKSRTKVKLEHDLMRANADKKSYQKELEAVKSYLDKLTSACTTKPDSYEERKARRESEIKSLKEALAFLNGEGMP